MIKVEINKTLMLNAIPKYSGIAYDGYWFYFTIKDEHKIIKSDIYFTQVEYFDTYRCYSYICYDCREKCFWAIDPCDLAYVYKLDKFFKDIDALSISTPTGEEIITGISYIDGCDKLLIAYDNVIKSIDKHFGEEQNILYNSGEYGITTVTDIFSCYICCCLSKQESEINLYSYSQAFITKFMIPYALKVVAMILVPSIRMKNQFHLYILSVGSKGEQCILDYVVRNVTIDINEQRYYNMIDNVAREGIRIAHTLNMESDKLKIALSTSNEKKEIISAYRSTCKIVNQAIEREQFSCYQLLKLKNWYDFL